MHGSSTLRFRILAALVLILGASACKTEFRDTGEDDAASTDNDTATDNDTDTEAGSDNDTASLIGFSGTRLVLAPFEEDWQSLENWACNAFADKSETLCAEIAPEELGAGQILALSDKFAYVEACLLDLDDAGFAEADDADLGAALRFLNEAATCADLRAIQPFAGE